MKATRWDAVVIALPAVKVFMRHAPFMLFGLVLPSFLLGADVAAVFEPVRTKSHSETVRANHAEYTIDVGGTVDMENTTTRLYETFQIAFQNNVSLTIANTGETIVKNPRVITGGKRRWWCMVKNDAKYHAEHRQTFNLMVTKARP